jgi:pyruvate-formate lyase-activating enzyme
LDFSLLPDWQLRLATNPPESPPEKLLSLPETLYLIEELAIERAIYIGIEPTLDPGFPALAKALKTQYQAYNILFTNALVLPDISNIDEIIVSLKAITPELYREYTAADNRKALHNFRKIYETGKKLQAEITLIPGIIEADEVEKAAEFIASVNPSIPLRINGFISLNGVEYRAPSGEEVETAANLAKKHLNTVNYLSGEMSRVGDPPVRVY